MVCILAGRLSVVLYAVNIIDVDRRWLLPDNEA